jgi:hypothetical protein
MADIKESARTTEGSASPVSATHPVEKTSYEGPVGEENAVRPKLHAKTFLAIFAVCLIYYAQLFNVVGAGAVSLCSPLAHAVLTLGRAGAPPRRSVIGVDFD